MLVDRFCAATAWNAVLLDRESGNIAAGSGVLRAATPWSATIVEGFQEDLDNYADTVSKTVSINLLADVKKRYCVTLPHLGNSKITQKKVIWSTKAGHQSTTWTLDAQIVERRHDEYLARWTQRVKPWR